MDEKKLKDEIVSTIEQFPAFNGLFSSVISNELEKDHWYACGLLLFVLVKKDLSDVNSLIERVESRIGGNALSKRFSSVGNLNQINDFFTELRSFEVLCERDHQDVRFVDTSLANPTPDIASAKQGRMYLTEVKNIIHPHDISTVFLNALTAYRLLNDKRSLKISMNVSEDWETVIEQNYSRERLFDWVFHSLALLEAQSLGETTCEPDFEINGQPRTLKVRFKVEATGCGFYQVGLRNRPRQLGVSEYNRMTVKLLGKYVEKVHSGFEQIDKYATHNNLSTYNGMVLVNWENEQDLSNLPFRNETRSLLSSVNKALNGAFGGTMEVVYLNLSN